MRLQKRNQTKGAIERYLKSGIQLDIKLIANFDTKRIKKLWEDLYLQEFSIENWFAESGSFHENPWKWKWKPTQSPFPDSYSNCQTHSMSWTASKG